MVRTSKIICKIVNRFSFCGVDVLIQIRTYLENKESIHF